MEYIDEANVPLIMKNKFTVLFFAFVLLIAIFWLLRGGEKPKLGLAIAAPSTNAPAPNKSNEPNVIASQTNTETNDTTFSESRLKPTTLEEANAKIRQTLEAQNKPIEVWGKVVDQDGASLSGVKVQAAFGHFVWPPEQYPNGVTSGLELLTDANGQFHIQDNSATGVGVVLQKNGYEQESPKGSGYALGSGGGTKDNPVVLRMWGTNILQKLVAGGNHFHIVPDGRPYFINLTDGTISESEGGDLKVWIQYTNQVVRSQLYDWSAGINAINGGLLEETNLDFDSMFVAPKDGYMPSFHFDQQILGGQSGSTGGKFYLMLKNGQEYGRMQFDLIAPYDARIPGLIRFSYAINPSGSRILR